MKGEEDRSQELGFEAHSHWDWERKKPGNNTHTHTYTLAAIVQCRLGLETNEVIFNTGEL